MTLAEYLAKNNGQWMDGAAVVMDRGGYYTRLAVGSESSFELTQDGKRLLGDAPKPEKQLVDTSADMVQSSKKRGKKAAVSTDELNLDDL